MSQLEDNVLQAMYSVEDNILLAMSPLKYNIPHAMYSVEDNILLAMSPLTVTHATKGSSGACHLNLRFKMNILSVVFSNFPSGSAIVDSLSDYFFYFMIF